MKKTFGLPAVIALSVCIFIAVMDSAREEDRFLLKEDGPVILSLETGASRENWTPVSLDLQGLQFTFWMDAEGRVFPKKARESLLFRLDMAFGRMRNPARNLAGICIERNSWRTRLMFNDLNAALILDVEDGRAALDLRGLVIPVPVLFGPEADGVRVLRIGDERASGQASLCLDLRKKQLFWDAPDSVGRDDESKRIYWAVG